MCGAGKRGAAVARGRIDHLRLDARRRQYRHALDGRVRLLDRHLCWRAGGCHTRHLELRQFDAPTWRAATQRDAARQRHASCGRR